MGEKVLSYEVCPYNPPTLPIPSTHPPTHLPTQEFVYVVERKYLQPATKIGPEPREVLEPLVLVFETPDGVEEERKEEERVAVA